MEIISPAFANNKQIPSKYTCDGENINPPLIISNVPNEAVSLVLTVEDPDAPAGIWTHWTVWNIDPKTTQVHEGEAPGGVQGITSFGTAGYGGPCPHSGTHHYIFKLYALSELLELPVNTPTDEIKRAMIGKIISQAGIQGIYDRSFANSGS